MIQPIYYMQTDSRWKNHNYSAPGENKTIGSSGCGVACSAMVIATLKNKNITPVETAEWSMAHGYKALNQGTYYTYFIPQFKEYGIECKRLNTSNLYGKSSSTYHTEALNALKNGGFKAKLIMQVHDELIVDCPVEEQEEVCKLLKREMENACKLSVPLEVDAVASYRWSDGH